jgi:hypothetical protein
MLEDIKPVLYDIKEEIKYLEKYFILSQDEKLSIEAFQYKFISLNEKFETLRGLYFESYNHE